jgi:hypothetical protein
MRNGLNTKQGNRAGIHGENDGQQRRWRDDSTLEHPCGGGERFDKRNNLRKFVLYGGDVQDKSDDVSAGGLDRHAQINCQLRDFGVPEVLAFGWWECDDLKYLAVGPAYRGLFHRSALGTQGRLTRNERCEAVLIHYEPYGDHKGWDPLG